MMKAKIKGTAAERELIHLFWKNNWAAFRAAGSGSIKYPVPDIIAGNNLRKLAIEVKSTKEEKKYLTREDIDKLRTFSRMFGAEPWFAIRFDKKQWFFLNIEDIQETEKQFVINKEIAERRGLSFEEVIGIFRT